MTTFLQNNDIRWKQGIKEMHLVLKDDKNLHAHKRLDSEKFFPTTSKCEWLTADLHPSLTPQGFSPLGQGHPRHSRFESKKPCETKP